MAADLRADAASIFGAAVAAVAPEALVSRALRREGEFLTVQHTNGKAAASLKLRENVKVFGFGKAAAGMVAAVDALLHEHITGGVAVVPVGTLSGGGTLPAVNCVIQLREGAPDNIPDQAAHSAAAEVLAGVEQCGEDDIILLCITGGGSALLPAPVEGVSLDDKREATIALARAGATIEDLNVVRKHLSRVKGGQLGAAAYPATTVALILSDVVGDPLDIIASGPTVPDNSSYADALAVVDRLGAADVLPPSVLRHLKAGAANDVPETPGSDHPAYAAVASGSNQWLYNVLVGTNAIALQAAATEARRRGYTVEVAAKPLVGEAQAAAMSTLAEMRASRPSATESPRCILAGGETTVVVRGHGRGGRNQELALSAGLLMTAEDVGLCLLSAGTDGQDGPTDAAGGFADCGLRAACTSAGVDPDAALSDNDSYTALGAAGYLCSTGLTGTNVMDVVVGLVAPS